MNFDSKYLIRWGIPGWVTMLAYLFTIIWIERDVVWNGEFKVVESLGALISLGFIGIVLGYIMHQIYFAVNWIFSKQSEKINDELISLLEDGERKEQLNRGRLSAHDIYFNIEYEWHKQLLLVEESKRNYINDRYRYLLSTVHALGALQVAVIFSIIGIISIGLRLNYWDVLLTSFLTALIILLIVIIKGFSYYSRNLISFQSKFFNAFFNGEYINIQNNYPHGAIQEERIGN